jgi:glutamate synthase (NADPH/NADH) small chain
MDVLKKVPVREQDPKVRATNFDEVCLGYNKEEAMEEASRCINCKNAKCIQGCPVAINIPAFINEVKEKDIPLEYPEMTLFMIIELVSSTVFTSIVEKQPLPIEEFKPHLYKTIRLLINEKLEK